MSAGHGRRLRQLVVVAELGSGGAENIVVQLAVAAARRGDDVLVASAGGWRTGALDDAGVRHLQVPLAVPRWVDLLRTVRSLRDRLRREPVDVVHAHNPRAALAAWLAVVGPRRRPRVLVTVHGLLPGRYRTGARVLRVVADDVVAVSDDVRDRLVAGGLRPDRVAVVPHAPAVPERAPRAAARAGLGLPDDVPVVLCLARLAPPKRIDLLLEALPRLPGAVVLVAGHGPLRPALEARARRLGITDRVRFLGDRRDVGTLLGAADVLVLPSDQEGMPLSVLEAMATGVPVVASRVGGLAELDGAVALVPPGDSAALEAALRAALDDPYATAGRVGTALEEVARRFSADAMVEAYERRLHGVFRR